MKSQSEAGFSYIDVTIAMVILLIGILGMVSAITVGVTRTKGQEQQLAAKQIATTTMESIMSVKETDPARLGWNAIGNVGSNTVNGTPRGVFLTNFQDVRTDAGADEVVGTADDSGTIVNNVQRRIQITDVCDPDRRSYNCSPAGNLPVRIRQVIVTVRYFIGSLQRDETVTTVLTDYAIAR